MAQLTIDVTGALLSTGQVQKGRSARTLWSTLTEPMTAAPMDGEAGEPPLRIRRGESEYVLVFSGLDGKHFRPGDQLVIYYQHEMAQAGYAHLDGNEVFVQHVLARADVAMVARIYRELPLEMLGPRGADTRQRWRHARERVVALIEEAETRGLDSAMALGDTLDELGVSAHFVAADGGLVSVQALLGETKESRGGSLDLAEVVITQAEETFEAPRPDRVELRKRIEAIRSALPLGPRG